MEIRRQHDPGWLPKCHGLEKNLRPRLLEREFLIHHWHHVAQLRRRLEIVDYPVLWLQEGQDGCRIGRELVAVSRNTFWFVDMEN